MVMKDALDGTVLTSLDLKDMERRYGTPYMVIHRSDLHGLFLQACRDAGVDLRTSQHVTEYENAVPGSTGPGSAGARARVRLADGAVHEARLVVAADGLHSVARGQLVGDEPVNSAYVAYRGAVPMEKVRENNISESDVVVYVGPGCHFVQYPLRGGDMFNQVAVFESARAKAGEEDWGTPDELDAAFAARDGERAEGAAAHAAGPLVAHVRPRPDHDLGLRPDRAARRRRAPAAAVHRPGRDHGDRGRLRARRAPGREPGRLG